MDPRILFVSTYPALSNGARILSQRLDAPMDIIQGGIMSDGHLHAKSVASRYDVIVSQGGTAVSIGEEVSIPVAPVRITVADFLKAFEKARKFAAPLAIVCYRGELEIELRSLARLFSDVPHVLYPYANKEDFIAQINKALAMKEATLMGFGSCTRDMAVENGLNYILIRSNIQNLRKAILTAKNIVDANKREKIEARRLKNLIHYSNEGIVSCDKNLVVQAVNEAAENILHIDAQNMIGKSLDDPATSPILRSLYGDGRFVVNRLLHHKKTSLMFNRIPLDVNDELEESIMTFQDVSYIQKLETSTRMQLHSKGLVARRSFEDIIGSSQAIRKTVERARRFSATSVSVLIEGETGAGKELFAHSVHNASDRAQGPFVAINCAALPESLLESELFGYEEGAFTGAKKGGKAGLFELAHNGTIFLDEIGEISSLLQSRLLRAINEKEILRIGGGRIIHVDVRVIAATNKNLYKLVLDGRFRRDLYFRLDLLNLTLPPLRERAEDIDDLARSFIPLKNAAHGRNMPLLSKTSLRRLQAYSWPGNVRELEYFLEKLVVLYDDCEDFDCFVAETLREHMERREDAVCGEESADTVTLRVGSMKDMQAQIVASLLERNGGNKGGLAKQLGVSRTTIWKIASEQGL
ncbi:MAG: sigma 54-interacting transcriptional regulator [Desulfovibrionaceae bacterium]